jgi:hypothetical protein
MQRSKCAETDRSLEVVPAIRHTVPWQVTAVEPLTGQRLRVTFVAGTCGEVSMAPLLASAAVEGTVFAALRDPDEFGNARVILGAVQWPGGAELSPDAMYDAIRASGSWSLPVL